MHSSYGHIVSGTVSKTVSKLKVSAMHKVSMQKVPMAEPMDLEMDSL